MGMGTETLTAAKLTVVHSAWFPSNDVKRESLMVESILRLNSSAFSLVSIDT